jgi:hypothetical protein
VPLSEAPFNSEPLNTVTFAGRATPNLLLRAVPVLNVFGFAWLLFIRNDALQAAFRSG